MVIDITGACGMKCMGLPVMIISKTSTNKKHSRDITI